MKTQRPIEVGDLVVVTKPNTCCNQGHMGMIFEVEQIETTPGICRFCQQSYTVRAAKVKGRKFWIDLKLVKLIPGLGELSRIVSEEVIRA